MSMNFNKSGSPPPPPPKKNNDKIKMIIGVIAGISGSSLNFNRCDECAEQHGTCFCSKL